MEEEADLPELDNLMKDSVLSEANLSAVQTPRETSPNQSSKVDSTFERQLLDEFEEMQ